MEDYDWLAGNYQFNNWTHRSIHPNTDLERYLNLDIAIGYDVAVTDAARVNLHGGFKYTNVKWTATGGSYVRSTRGTTSRDNIGNFPNVPVNGLVWRAAIGQRGARWLLHRAGICRGLHRRRAVISSENACRAS